MKAEASVAEKELVELCFVHLGNYKRPAKVVLRRDPLPKTPVSKIRRRNFVSRSGLDESAGSQATEGVRGTLARMSQGALSIHRVRRVL